MKRLTSSLVICMLMLGTAACTSNTETDDPPQSQQISIDTETAISDMTAPVDALVRCMLENDMTYDPEDSEFFWTALCYFAGAYGQHHPLAELSDTDLALPTQAVQEHAIALFADYDDLPEIPADLSFRVTYDADSDTYHFSLGDIGLSETTLTFEEEQNGIVTVRAELRSTMEDKSLIGAWRVTMTENTYADSIEEPLYLYSISSVTPLDETTDDTTSSETVITETITASYNGLSDGHTVELTLEDGSIEAFQFTDADVSAKLQQLQTGDSLTITYTQERKDAAMVITAVL